MNAGIYFNKKYISDNVGNVGKISEKMLAAGWNCKEVDCFTDLDGLDILYVLGGDGTILHMAAECAVRGIKIIGINYGHIGFLAEFEPEKLDEAIGLVLSGNYKSEKRDMLEIEFDGNKFYALNDFVLQRNTCGSNFSNTVSIVAEIDGTTVDNISADGIIISTPTGSTAYSLAAGGSVLSPELNAFILTPICAHSLHSRPIVFNSDSVVKVRGLNSGYSLVVAVDGKTVGEYKGGEIRVAKAARTAEFITSGDKNFFKKLLLKLSFWSK